MEQSWLDDGTSFKLIQIDWQERLLISKSIIGIYLKHIRELQQCQWRISERRFIFQFQVQMKMWRWR